jgi:hypothetical protein
VVEIRINDFVRLNENGIYEFATTAIDSFMPFRLCFYVISLGVRQ